MTENRIVQLAPEGLNRLLDDSLPISPQTARIALSMRQAGHDAAAIAARTGAHLGAVTAFLEALRRKDPLIPVSAPRKPVETASPSAPTEQPANELADAPPAAAETAKPLIPREIPREIELSALQLALIRRLRKAHVSTATISQMTRIAVDQVMRVAGEIP